MIEPPDQQQLENAIVELRRNYAFGVFHRWLMFVREENVQECLNPNYSERLGMLNRGAGNIEAYDTILSRVGIVNQNLDKLNKLVSDPRTEDAGRSGPITTERS